MKTLCYDDELHEYTSETDSAKIKVPSVTRIVSALTGKDLSGIPPKILETARLRGNAIHEDVEKGRLETKEAQWIEKHLDRKRCMFEVMGTSEIGGVQFAGRTDIVDGNILWDVKTEGKPSILYWTLQLNMYRKFFENVTELKVLHTPKTGEYRIYSIKVLGEEKMKEIMQAYKDGVVLTETFIEDEVKNEESLDLIVLEHDSGKLITNAQDILDSVRLKVAGYKPENYSEETVDLAAKDKAMLNNLEKVLNDKRKMYEKKHMEKIQPELDIIKTACKEIKEASGAIDVLVKEVITKAKDEKKQLLESFYGSLGNKIVDFELIFESSWLNKGTKEEDAKNAIVARVGNIYKDLDLLDRIGEPDAKAFYLNTLNFESAMEMCDRLKANKQKILEASETKKANEAIVVINIPEGIKTSQEAFRTDEPIYTKTEIKHEPDSEKETLERTMRVWGTKEQLIILGNFMDDNGIMFRKMVDGDYN